MEKIEDLGINNLKVIQDDSLYNFTSDAILLSSFLKIKSNERALEIGVGSGVISILASSINNYKEIIGFEIQKPLFDLAYRNLEMNNLKDIKFINDDIKNYANYLTRESFDVIYSNPPYKKLGSFTNQNEVRAIARHEVKLNLDELVTITKNLLKYGGRCYFCYDANRAIELIYKLKANSLEPKEIQFTYPNKNTEATLVFIKAIKGAKEGVTFLKPIFVNN